MKSKCIESIDREKWSMKWSQRKFEEEEEQILREMQGK